MPNTTLNNIINCVNSGVRRAVKDYINLAGDAELSWGPEYFITANIARELKKLDSAQIVLEEKMGDSFSPKGRRPLWFAPKNRFDIVVRKGNTNPAAAIEVKHRVYSISPQITKDIKRLSGAVNRKAKDEAPFKYGIFAFYTIFEDSEFKRKTAVEAVKDLYKRLESKFEDESGDASVSNRFIKPKRYHDFPGMTWGGGCIFFCAP
jgi:hypothetical protein